MWQYRCYWVNVSRKWVRSWTCYWMVLFVPQQFWVQALTPDKMRTLTNFRFPSFLKLTILNFHVTEKMHSQNKAPVMLMPVTPRSASIPHLFILLFLLLFSSCELLCIGQIINSNGQEHIEQCVVTKEHQDNEVERINHASSTLWPDTIVHDFVPVLPSQNLNKPRRNTELLLCHCHHWHNHHHHNHHHQYCSLNWTLISFTWGSVNSIKIRTRTL